MMLQNKLPFISQNKQSVPKLLAILAFCALGLAVACDDTLEDADNSDTDTDALSDTSDNADSEDHPDTNITYNTEQI